MIYNRGSSKLVQTNVGTLSYCVAHSRQPAAHSHAAPLLKYTEASHTAEFAALYAFEIAKINIEIKKICLLSQPDNVHLKTSCWRSLLLFTAKFYFCGLPHALAPSDPLQAGTHIEIS